MEEYLFMRENQWSKKGQKFGYRSGNTLRIESRSNKHEPDSITVYKCDGINPPYAYFQQITNTYYPYSMDKQKRWEIIEKSSEFNKMDDCCCADRFQNPHGQFDKNYGTYRFECIPLADNKNTKVDHEWKTVSRKRVRRESQCRKPHKPDSKDPNT